MQINLKSLKGKIVAVYNKKFNAISHVPIKGVLALLLDVLVVKSQTISLTPNHSSTIPCVLDLQMGDVALL
jgi:hypothetical protein